MNRTVALSKVFIHLTLGNVGSQVAWGPVFLPSLPRKGPREMALLRSPYQLTSAWAFKIPHGCLLIVVTRCGLDFLPRQQAQPLILLFAEGDSCAGQACNVCFRGVVLKAYLKGPSWKVASIPLSAST